MAAVYVFSEGLSAQTVGAIHRLGPGYKVSCELLYGCLCEQAKGSESCVLIGYPSKQDEPVGLPALFLQKWNSLV